MIQCILLELVGHAENGQENLGQICGYASDIWSVRKSDDDIKELHQNSVTQTTLIIALTCVGYLASAFCWGSLCDIFNWVPYKTSPTVLLHTNGRCSFKHRTN